MKPSDKRHVKILKDEVFCSHLQGVSHPESPNRLRVIYDSLQEMEGILPISYIRPRPALKEELELIHEPEYIKEIETVKGFPVYLDPDTPMTEGSYRAAISAAGGLLEAVDTTIKNGPSPVFSLIRPPGHHAERDRAKGFCLFNNIAIAARYAQERYGIKRALICDWDVHHGNGTQHAFYADPSILYFSIHQYPFYPGTGRLRDIGSGTGEGYTINCPIPSGQGDSEYDEIFKRIFVPIALSFNPELILVSAGFDPYILDPIGGMEVTEEGFGLMTQAILKVSESCCPGRTVFALEGGYHLQGLRSCFAKVIETICRGMEDEKETCRKEIRRQTPGFLDEAIACFSKYWPVK